MSEKSYGKRVKVPVDSIPKAHPALRDQIARWRLERKIAVANEPGGCMLLWLGMPKWKSWLLLLGVGLAVYGILNFHAWGGPVGSPVNRGWEVGYTIEAKLEAAIGAVLISSGFLLKKSDEE